MIASNPRGVRTTTALYVVAVCASLLTALPGQVAAQRALPVADAAGPRGAPLGSPVPTGLAPGAATRTGPLGRRLDAEASPMPTGLADRGRRRRSTGFLDRQLRFPRVREAFEDKRDGVTALFRQRGVEAPAEIYIRVFKHEKVLEIWARDQGQRTFSLVSTYPVCRLSGRLGPKRREGDGQIPEGFYAIDMFNPWSEYHLSMRLDYPNAVDRARGRAARLGGDIFIHGGCATVGCVPMTDEAIQELYLMAAGARDAGQRRIPVHIFPARLDADGMRWLAGAYGSGFVDFPFWQNLQEGYLAFERTRTLPSIGTHGGEYVVVPDLPAPDATVTVSLR